MHRATAPVATLLATVPLAAALAATVLAFAALLAAAQAKIGGNGLIFAAASLKEPLDRAVARLAAGRHCVAPGGTIRVSYASSGILARQIGRGAPADLFISADPRWLDYLERQGRIAPGTRRTLFGNRLVAIAPRAGTVTGPRAIAGPLDPDSPVARRLGRERLAIGDPGHVPAGRYARAALRALGLWQQAQRNMVLAANVRFAAAYVARREAALGIVYATDARAEPRVGVVARIPADTHPPIRYDAAILRGGDAACARRWLEALGAPALRRIFADAGYAIPE